MFKTLVRKEITELIFDLRFAITMLLCLVLVPLGMYVNRKDYERRLDAYRREHQEYRQRYGKGVEIYAEAQGLRPPSALSIFASGVDPFLPDKMITVRSGLWRTVKEPSTDNPHSLLFGKADFLFNVVFLLSLAALIFTFDSISGERQMGTLRLMMANSVPRSRILLSKIAGNYVALLIPFAVSILVSLLVLDASPDVSVGSRAIWPAFLLMLGATLLFLLGMVTLGICISTLTASPMNSMVLAFFVWAILVLGIPKLSPMLAGILFPVENANVVDLTKRLTVEDSDWALIGEKEKLVEKRFKEYGASEEDRHSSVRSEAGQKAMAKFEEESAPLVQQYEKQLADRFRQVGQDYARRKDRQSSLAINLSRISPACSYTYLVCGLSGTGVTEPDNFTRNAQRYQDAVKQAVYDKVIVKRMRYSESYEYVDGTDLRTVVLPEMVYTYPGVARALQAGWPDLLLLGFCGVLFGSLAFLRLSKYDVR